MGVWRKLIQIYYTINFKWFVSGRWLLSHEENPEKIKEDYVDSDSTELQGGTSSAQATLLGRNEVKHNYVNVWKHIRNREMGLDTKSKRSMGFSEPEKSRVFSRYLPNAVKEVVQNSAKVFCGSYSQDGSVFMSASQDCHIKLYETSSGKLKEFQDVVAQNVGWSIVDTAYSHDQRHLIYSSWSSDIYLCDIAGGYERSHVALHMRPSIHSFCAFSIKFSQDDNEILTGSNDGSIYIYNRGCGRRTLRIDAHSDDVNTVCFCDNTSQLLFSGSDDGVCKVWDRRTLNEERPKPVGIFAGHACGIACIDSKGDGRYLITSSKDQSIKLWDMRKFSDAKGKWAGARAVATNQYWDYRWEGLPKKFQKEVKLKGDVSVMTYRGHSLLRCLSRAYFSPLETTGQEYIYTGSADGCVYIYDLHSGKLARKLYGHNGIVRDVSWHPSKPYITSSSWDCTVKCWQYTRDKDEIERSEKEIAQEKLEKQTKRPKWHPKSVFLYDF
ncbi:DDB1- and CUL4-associated factor 11 [Paramuricea clavata]|uniref:DDB1- and CUL4-associated factor 11 n=1 Tax=Paramuricea clavata TaxID=317549 RepID=A0A7D9EBQ6_PARCT|nr:DDB1- and CUL4-associated factor 11 [Paramuricea clavata]